MAHLVFVYGTLMKGQLHHATLAHARFVRPAATRPEFDLVKIDYYPAMLPGGSTRVVGELFEVDDLTLRYLDELEEVPHYYERLTIELADGSEAFAYIMPRERGALGTPISSGCFRTHNPR